ncbi:MAG: hypothetical protein K0S44_2312 [Bacteroidetes bacterium]|nr:hypothetical protein [Bacteroidota bacterium]
MKKISGLLFIAFAGLFSACSTDLEVIGDWKETMVVYGLLDQSQPKQYIKINKAFLGEGNAFEFAQIKDSVQFVNSLNVTLKRIRNGAEIASYTLTPDNSIPKDPGVFYSANQQNAIYSFNSTGASALADDSQYKLVIRSNETGTEVSSQTPLVKDFGTLVKPNPSTTVASLIVTGATTTYTYPYNITFNSGLNASVYQVVIRFLYKDSTTTGTFNDSIDWNLSQKETPDLSGGDLMDFTIKGQDFMRYLGNTLKDYPTLKYRIPGKFKIIVIGAGEELNTFINVNRPSTGIIQEKPEYTNITNGLGIFSARTVMTKFEAPLSTITRDTLSGGKYTACLKFLNPSGVWDPNRCN